MIPKPIASNSELVRKTSPLRVVHVVLSLDCGGLERMVLSLIRAGRALGQEVHVLCIERPGVLSAAAQHAGAHLMCMSQRGGYRRKLIRQIQNVFQEMRPDVVHTHQIGPLLYGGRAAHRSAVPLVVHTEHGNHLKGIRPWLKRLRYRLIWRMASRSASRFFCVSGEILESMKAAGLRKEKLVLMANGIDTNPSNDGPSITDLREKWRLRPDQPVIGTVGRLAEIKRQDLMLRSFALTLIEHPFARLMLVGDGTEGPALQELARSLGIEDSVTFVGYDSHPEAYLRLFDVFVLTSRSEGMPVAMLEAWAAGKPVVATAVGGVPDLVVDGVNGWLAQFGDEKAIASALCRVLSDPERANRMGEAGRQKVCIDFSLEKTAAAYDSAYHELLANRGGQLVCESSR